MLYIYIEFFVYMYMDKTSVFGWFVSFHCKVQLLFFIKPGKKICANQLSLCYFVSEFLLCVCVCVYMDKKGLGKLGYTTFFRSIDLVLLGGGKK